MNRPGLTSNMKRPGLTSNTNRPGLTSNMKRPGLTSNINRPTAGGWALVLVWLMSGVVPSLAFSLKNCTIDYSDNTNDTVVKCSLESLDTIPDDIPRNSTSLDLSINIICKIKRLDLRHLSKLTFLNFSYNSISFIEDGAFTGLTQVQTLLIDDNKLTNLTDHMFKGLSKLVTLSLQWNNISYIFPLAFESLLSLNSLDLSGNHLHQITDIGPLFQLPSLKELFLLHNEFISFQPGDLPFEKVNITFLDLGKNPLRKFTLTKDVFPYLQTLQLRQCHYDIEWDVANKTFLRSLTQLYLRESTFSFETYTAMLHSTESLQILVVDGRKLLAKEIQSACLIPSLRTLKITDSKTKTINDTLLQSCSQLTELILSNNDFSELSEGSLKSMTRLRLLNLARNHLTKVPITLQQLSKLEKLDLSFNYITELHQFNFMKMENLIELNLENNHISRLEQGVFQNLYNLKILNIGNNALVTLNNTFKVNMPKLEILKLHNNGHMTLKQGEFRNLSALWFLDLQSKKYSQLSDGTFEGLDNLQTLYFATNYYSNESFKGLTQLQHLILYDIYYLNNRAALTDEAPPFSNIVNLKTLQVNLQHGVELIFILPDLLSGLKSLQYFSADNYFHISIHPDTFTYSPELRSLTITNSFLTFLTPQLFHPIPKLKKLDLSYNKLKSLDFLTLANLLQLRQLKLCHNKVSVINDTTFQTLPALTYLDLTNNHLTCECSNAGFSLWVQRNNQTQVVNGHLYPCAFPVSRQDQLFLDFDVQSCWIDAGFLCFISTTCLIVFTIITSLVYNFLRWHLAYAYYLLRAFLHDTKVRKKDTHQRYDAFISYNVHDEDWVYREMLPVLEGEQGWRLCLHHRDFQPGKPIVENITDAIYGSRKTICVISRHYLQSEWCSREIQMASFRLFDEKKDVLILLFLEDIPARHLSPYYRMRQFLKKRTYLSWPQATQHTGVFWQNVCRALKTGDSLTGHGCLLPGPPDLL